MKILSVIILLMVAINSFSQSYIDDIATKTCDCLKVLPDTLDQEMMQVRLGLCMIEVALPYKKQLKKNHNIDLDKIENEHNGAELGRMVGVKMGAICPESFVKMFEKTKQESSSKNSYEGQITNIEEEPFVVFSIKDDNGKLTKFYWLSFINSSVELSSTYKSLINTSVKVSFVPQEFFDPKLGEYRVFNVLVELEKQSE